MNYFTPDLTPVSMETITLLDPVSHELICVLEEVQDFTVSQDETTTDITGRNGRKLNTLKRNKSVTVSGNSGVVSAGLIGLQTGTSFEQVSTATINVVDTLTVEGNKATTSRAASGTTGAEIITLALKNKNGTMDSSKKFTQSSAVAAGAFTYNPDTKELAFYEGDIEDGTEIAVMYDSDVQGGYVHTNHSDVFSSKAEVYIDFIAEDTCSVQYRDQIHIPMADVSGTFSREVGTSQTVQAFELTALAGSCGSAGKFWEETIIGIDSDD
jgi:hypothetical protein